MSEHEETIDGITYTLEIEPEDIPVRGNAVGSGDDDTDKAIEDRILAELDSGNLWAWCQVKVTASFEEFEGAAYLGGCSYKDAHGFMRDGYYKSMRDDAQGELLRLLGAARQALHKLETGKY